MKRIILLCGLLTAFFLCFADAVEYKQSIPATGSTISSFDFELEFDIEKALVTAEAAKPGNQFGIGYRGGINSANAKLYKGDAETGELLGTTNTANFTGKSEGFEINGNKIKVSFDSSIPVLSNQIYTVKIDNAFFLYPSGSAVFVTATKQDFANNPIILTFTGASSEKVQLLVDSSDIQPTADYINRVEFTLNSSFNIKSGAEVLIKENEEIVERTSNLKVSTSDNKVLVAEFNNVPLLLGHSYTIELPDNSLTHVDDPTVGNFIYKVSVNGNKTIEIPLKSSKVDKDSNGLPTAVTFIYDLPDGTTLDGMRINYFNYGFLSVEGSETSTNFDNKCSIIENGKGLKWDISSVKFEPSTRYNFTKDGNTLIVFDSQNTTSTSGWIQYYSGEDATISFTTPSVDELGFPPITVGTAKIGRYDDTSTPDFVDGGTYANIQTLEIMRVEYVHNGKTYKPNLDGEGEKKAYIYDVTDGSRVPVKEITMAIDGRGGDDDGGFIIRDYSVFIIRPQMEFLQDHTYQIVIPKGVIRLSSVQYANLYNYVMNDEIVYTVKGATPTEFTVDGCSIENNAEMSSLPPVIVWTLNGAYELKNSDVTADGNYSGTTTGKTKLPMTIKKEGYKTYVAVHLIDTKTGYNRPFSNGNIFTVTIPAGSIVYPGEESLSNPALTVSVKGIEEVIPTPETVNVNLTINDLHSASHKAVKGETYSFAVQPNDSNWEVESVKHGDKSLTQDENGMFVTEPLNADAEIKANLKYNGAWAFEDKETGIWSVNDSDLRIYNDGDFIVVEGVEAGSLITVYNEAGMLVNSDRVSDGKDKAYITVAPKKIYIVTVNGVAAKIYVK